MSFLCLCGIYTCVVHTSTIRAKISNDFPCNPRSSHAAEAAIGQTSGRPLLSKTVRSSQEIVLIQCNTHDFTFDSTFPSAIDLPKNMIFIYIIHIEIHISYRII